MKITTHKLAFISIILILLGSIAVLLSNYSKKETSVEIILNKSNSIESKPKIKELKHGFQTQFLNYKKMNYIIIYSKYDNESVYVINTTLDSLRVDYYKQH